MAQKQRAFLVGQNLLFMPRVQSAASAYGYEVKQTRSEPEFWAACQQGRPAIVIVDLEGEEDTWAKVLEGIGRRREAGVKVVAFGPHADVAALERARKLGCDLVLTKGELSGALPKIFAAQAAATGS